MLGFCAKREARHIYYKNKLKDFGGIWFKSQPHPVETIYDNERFPIQFVLLLHSRFVTHFLTSIHRDPHHICCAIWRAHPPKLLRQNKPRTSARSAHKHILLSSRHSILHANRFVSHYSFCHSFIDSHIRRVAPYMVCH